MALTGVGATIFETTSTDTKFVTANFKVRGISGGGRSLAVIDDSHLGQTKGQALELCFADLHSHEPWVVDAQMDTENITIFESIADGTAEHDNPVMLGVNKTTGAAPTFSLVLPESSTVGNQATLVFSGAIIRDSGYNLVTTDRPRTTLTIQPDGKSYAWTLPS